MVPIGNVNNVLKIKEILPDGVCGMTPRNLSEALAGWLVLYYSASGWAVCLPGSALLWLAGWTKSTQLIFLFQLIAIA